MLGAGIAGLAAADRLVGQGYRVMVIEQTDRCGGTHRSRNLGPYTFDVGSFFYNPDALVLQLAPGLAEACHQVWREQRRIVPSGQIMHYPIEPRELLRGSIGRTALGLADMLLARARVQRDGSLDALTRQRLGRTFFTDTGLRAYITRFHHVAPEEIDEEFFFHRMGFIEKMTRPGNMVRKGLVSLFSGKRINAGIRRQQLVRPLAGHHLLFDPIRARLEAAGVRFCFGEAPQAIEQRAGEFCITTSSGQYRAGAVVSTIPIDVLHRLLFGEPSGLVFLDMTTLFVSARALARGLGNTFFNFHQQGLWKRTTVYSRLYPEAPTDREFFSVEVTIKEGARHDPERAFADFAAHLEGLGLADGLKLEGAELVASAYPLYRLGAYRRADEVLARIAATGIVSAGRQGRFEYLPTANAVIRRVGAALQQAELPPAPLASPSGPADASPADASPADASPARPAPANPEENGAASGAENGAENGAARAPGRNAA